MNVENLLTASERTRVLRNEFDMSFAMPHSGTRNDLAVMLTIRVQGDPFAIPVESLTGLSSCPASITTVPSRVSHLLGLISRRGIVVPVFQMASLLGYPAVNATPNWLVYADETDPIAFAYDDFDGVIEVEPQNMHRDNTSVNGSQHVTAVARMKDAHYAILNIHSLAARIRQSAGIDSSNRSSNV